MIYIDSSSICFHAQVFIVSLFFYISLICIFDFDYCSYNFYRYIINRILHCLLFITGRYMHTSFYSLQHRYRPNSLIFFLYIHHMVYIIIHRMESSESILCAGPYTVQSSVKNDTLTRLPERMMTKHILWRS